MIIGSTSGIFDFLEQIRRLWFLTFGRVCDVVNIPSLTDVKCALSVSGLLDKATLQSCKHVSQHWQYLTEEIVVESKVKKMRENEAVILKVIHLMFRQKVNGFHGCIFCLTFCFYLPTWSVLSADMMCSFIGKPYSQPCLCQDPWGPSAHQKRGAVHPA